MIKVSWTPRWEAFPCGPAASGIVVFEELRRAPGSDYSEADANRARRLFLLRPHRGRVAGSAAKRLSSEAPGPVLDGLRRIL